MSLLKLDARRRELLRRRQGRAPETPEIPRRPAGEPAPLSFAQRRLWFFERLEPGTDRYHVPLLLRLEGELERVALTAALAALVRRHEALRTRFFEVDGEPRQEALRADAERAALPLVDLEGLPAPARDAAADALGARAARLPLDLGAGRPLRRLLLRLAARRHRLSLTFHHLVADGWSLGLLVRELGALYAGEEPPAPAVRYADYARWQRRRAEAGGFARSLAARREALAGCPDLDLPQREPGPMREGNRAMQLPAATAEALEAFAAGRQGTPFLALLAVYAALLHRWSGQRDFAIGSPVAGREAPGVAETFGCFVNMIALRVRLDPGLGFGELFDRLRAEALAAFDHAELPFERLVEELAPRRDGRPPIFQVALTVQAGPPPVPQLAGLRCEPLPVPHETAKFELLLTLARADDGRFVGEWEYDARRLEPTAVERLGRAFRRLAAAAAAEPAMPLGALPLLAAAERHRLSVEERPLGRSSGPPEPLWERFLRWVKTNPEAPALIFQRRGERRVWSYGELAARARAFAATLGGAGGDLVVIDRPRGAERIAAILGCAAAGRPYLPLDPEAPEARRRRLADDARAAPAVGRGRHPEAPAYALYTSGSTGRPKGVVVPRAAADRLFDALGGRIDLGVGAWSLFHSTAFDVSVWELWGALAHGASLLVVERDEARDPLALARRLAAERVEGVSLTPSALAALLAVLAERGELAAELAARVRWVACAGETLSAAVAAAFFRLFPDGRPALLNLYGPTETTVYATCERVRREDLGEEGRRPPSIGRPLGDLAIYLLDPARRLAALGAAGEIAIAGAGLAQGYLGRPAETAERFVPDPFSGVAGGRLYASGDLARRRADGRLDFLGRRDAQVQLRGFRVEPGEVAAQLAEHPAVARAEVLARPGADGEPALVAYVTYAAPRPGAAAEPETLRAWLGERLPAYMLPAFVVPLGELPLTPNGKLDVAALPDPLPAAGADDPPRGDTERAVAAALGEVLGLETIGREQDFFALGGHSLLATRVVARLWRRLGVELPVMALFAAPTVAGLARRIELARDAAEDPAAPPLTVDPSARRGGVFPASAAQRRLWFLDRLDAKGGAFNIPLALRLRGRLELAALAAALDRIVARHGALRTALPLPEGADAPVQRVFPPRSRALPLVDLGAAPGAADELHRRFAGRRFDLGREPLFAACALRLGAAEHALLLVFHHAVMDGWSLEIFLAELAAGYRPGEPPADAPPVAQYADYARWEQRGGAAAARREHLGYWRERLADAPPALDLPADRARGGLYRPGRVARRLPDELAARIGPFARALDATPFALLLALYGLLLHRWSGRDDLIVGSPAAGRERPEIERTIGCFVNLLPLRLDLGGDPSVAELVGRAAGVARGAVEHGALHFEELLEELAPERDAERAPFFSTLLNVQHLGDAESAAALAAPRLAGLEVEEIGPPEPGAKFDCTFYAMSDGRAMRWELVYDAALFDRRRMEIALAQLEALLRQAIDDAERPLSSLSLVVAGDGLPDPAAPAPRERPPLATGGTVLDRVRRLAAADGERAAIVDEAGAVSYAELIAAAAGVAAELAARGVGAGDRVALLGRRVAALPAALLGVWGARATAVLLDADEPADRLGRCLDVARPRLLLALGGAAPRLAAACDLVLRDPRDAEWPRALPDALHAPEPRAPAHLLFTSGSTGRPKGVLADHRPLAHFLAWQRRRFALGPGDRFALLSSPGHDPVLRDLFAPLTAGGTLWVPSSTSFGDGGELLRGLAAARVSAVHLTPALAELLLAAAPRGARLAALRLAFFGADRLAPETALAFRRLAPAARRISLYGATETPQGVAWHEVEDEAWGDGSPLGRGIDEVALLVLGAAGRGAGVGELGAVHVRSRHLLLGYAGEQRAAEGERLYATGDLGRYRPGGAVAFAGRGDRQLKIRGRRVEPAEIESLLEEHPEVARAAVVPRRRAGEIELAAFVEPRDREPRAAAANDVAARRLRRWLAVRLPPAMRPATLTRLPRLPRTAAGKIDRRALPDPPATPASAAARPATPIEELVGALWIELLELEAAPPPAASFFDLGGHSLLGARLLARIERDLGVALPLRTLFEAPTLAALARRIESAKREGGSGASPPLVPRAAPDRPPLAPAQERLWFVQRLDPASPAYNLPFALELRGALEPRTLAAALAAVAERQAVLRTALPLSAEGEPYQLVLPARAMPLPAIDLSALDAAAGERAAEALAAREAAISFDLGAAPPWRARLLRLPAAEGAARRALMLLTVHHAAADGWSLGILVRELAEAYLALRDGERPRWPPLAASYVDYALWTRERARDASLEHALSRLRHRLPAETPEIAGDRPRPARARRRAGRRSGRLPAPLVRALERRARDAGATPFMLLAAAFMALVHRLTGAPSAVLATPTAGRVEPALEPLIGVFVNTLLLAARTADETRFATLVERVREATLEAFDLAEIPFEAIVERLAPRRDATRTPLFQLMLAPQDVPGAPVELPGGLEIAPRPPRDAAARFDLSWLWLPPAADGSMRLDAIYDAGLFDASSVERLGRQLERLLAAALDAPATRLGELSLLGAGERHQLLVEWARPAAAATRSASDLGGAIAATAARFPERTAVEDAAGGRLSYRRLLARADAVARALVAAGASAAAPVAICLEPSCELIVALVAVLRAGAPYLPLDPAWPAERLALLLADAGCSLVLTTGAAEANLPADGGPRRLDPKRLDDAPRSAAALPAPGPADTAYLIYTSGSSGRPKGVRISHRAALTRLLWGVSDAAPAPVGASTRLLVSASPSFDMSVDQLFAPLLAGGCTLLPASGEARDPRRLVRRLAASGATRCGVAPAMLAAMLTAIEEEPEIARDLRLDTVTAGGEALSTALARRFRRLLPGVALENQYGPTETTVSTLHWRLAGGVGLGGRRVTIGRPVAEAEILILGAHGRPLPSGAAGELCTAGPALADGYHRRPARTASVFVPHPRARRPGERVYRSGDLARFTADGEVELFGRLDRQLQLRGVRVEPGEVEATLAEHPRVARAAVVARSGPAGPRLVAYAACPGDAAPTAAELRGFLERRLPAAMLPGAVVVLAALPLTERGKTDYRALPEPERADASRAPRDELERELTELWEELLGVEGVGIDDDFFALGGHSLLAVRLAAGIRRRLGIEAPLVELYGALTPAALAARLRGRRRPTGPLVELEPGDGTPWVWVHPGGGTVFAYRPLARRLPGPVLALEAPGLAPGETPLDDVGAFAALYGEAIADAGLGDRLRLGGWSFGGLIAFELARALAARGFVIEQLAVLDSGPEAAARLDEELDLLADAHESIPGLELDAGERARRAELAGAAPEEQLAWLAELARKRGVLGDFDLEAAARLVAVNAASRRAARAFRPSGRYPGRLLLLRAEEDHLYAELSADLGWSAVAAAVDVLRAPGRHETMVDEQRADRLAEILLASARRELPSTSFEDP